MSAAQSTPSLIPRADGLIELRLMSLTKLIAALSGFVLLPLGLLAQTEGAAPGCIVSRSGLVFHCPPGWFVINDEPNELAIGNYRRDAGTPATVFGGKGRAWFTIQTRPSAHKNVAQWVYAGRKLAPDAVESKFNVQNGDLAVSVTSLESTVKSGPAYFSCFFEIAGVPTLLELNYRAEDPKGNEYRSAVKNVIAGIVSGTTDHR
jgi:hypothetical protein